MNDQDPFALMNRAPLASTTQLGISPAEIKQQWEMLLVFYKAWEHLHSIGDKRKPANKRQAEIAALALVDAARPLRVLGLNHD